MNYILHVGIALDTERKARELDDIFNKAKDWIRYAPNCWLVYTNSDPAKWYGRLKAHLSDEPFLIVEVDLNNRQGYLPKEAWDWIKKQRNI